jgi:hypothetical protein
MRSAAAAAEADVDAATDARVLLELEATLAIVA